jgi:non-homologous end joining protein Ku
VVKYTTRSRQQLGVIVPHAKTGTLVLLSLIFAEDFREPPARALAIAKAQVAEQHVEAMGMILDALHDTVDALDELRDDAVALREELFARAEAGEMDVSVVEPLPEPEAAPDLMETMQASIAAVEARRAGKG